MPLLDLTHLLGKAYLAMILHKGHVGIVEGEFRAAVIDDAAFAEAARRRLAELEELDAHTSSAGGIAARDAIGATQLEFLRKALSP